MDPQDPAPEERSGIAVGWRAAMRADGEAPPGWGRALSEPDPLFHGPVHKASMRRARAEARPMIAVGFPHREIPAGSARKDPVRPEAVSACGDLPYPFTSRG
jgi:hypothetical protein